MLRGASGSHVQFARDLRSRVEETGSLDRGLRLGILARDAGGPAVPEPYDALARQIGADSSRVTDEQVQAVLRETGAGRDSFEVVLTAAIGAGLERWDAAQRAIGEASDAAS